jgi:hypothetical protein
MGSVSPFDHDRRFSLMDQLFISLVQFSPDTNDHLIV